MAHRPSQQSTSSAAHARADRLRASLARSMRRMQHAALARRAGWASAAAPREGAAKRRFRAERAGSPSAGIDWRHEKSRRCILRKIAKSPTKTKEADIASQGLLVVKAARVF